MYLAYLVGIIMGPLAGDLSNRIGNGAMMALGAAVFGLSLWITLIKSLLVIVASLVGICAGFFAVHASAAGSLNRKLTSSRGRANSLYVLFYYIGGAVGITLGGYAYVGAGWLAVTSLGGVILLLPFGAGIKEMMEEKERTRSSRF